jgi:hypothetical protein
MTMEKGLVNAATITEKPCDFRVYNEQANTSLLCCVNVCVMTYLGLQEIWWEEQLALISFLLFYCIQCSLNWKDDKRKEVITHVKPFTYVHSYFVAG